MANRKIKHQALNAFRENQRNQSTDECVLLWSFLENVSDKGEFSVERDKSDISDRSLTIIAESPSFSRFFLRSNWSRSNMWRCSRRNAEGTAKTSICSLQRSAKQTCGAFFWCACHSHSTSSMLLEKSHWRQMGHVCVPRGPAAPTTLWRSVLKRIVLELGTLSSRTMELQEHGVLKLWS